MANISFRTDLSSVPASLSTSNLPIPPSRIPRSAASSKVPDTIAHIRNICIHYIQTHMESGRITKESFRARHFDCSLLKRALVRVPQHRPQGGRHNPHLLWPWNGFIVLFETLGSTAAAPASTEGDRRKRLMHCITYYAAATEVRTEKDSPYVPQSSTSSVRAGTREEAGKFR